MIDDDPRIDPDDLRAVRFPGSRRRYEAPAVDQFLTSLVDRIAATNALVDELRQRLADAEQAGPAEAASSAESTSPFDRPDLSAMSDDELVGLVGTETAHVLSTARRAAEEIRTKAEEAAARVIREATASAQSTIEEAETASAELRAEAESAHADATAAAEAEVAELRATAADEVEAIKAAMREQADEAGESAEAVRAEAAEDAERIREEARDEGRSMVQEAKAVRLRVLDDLQQRRDIARAQVETLLAGRARLLTAYERVRADLELATTELEAAGPELDPDDGADELIAPLLDADEPAETATVDETPAEAVGEEVADDDDADDAIDRTDAVEEPRRVDEADAPADETTGEAPVAVEGPVAAPDDETPADDSDVDETDVDETELVADVVSDETVTDDAADAAETIEVADAEVAADSDADGADEGEERDVDALFARIRAERAESVARAQRVLSGESEVAAPPPPSDDDSAATDEQPDAPSTDAPSTDDLAALDRDAPTGDVDHVPSEFLAPDPMLEARAVVIDELDAKLSRALKRHLADEQNEVLDGLRRSQSTDIAELLPAAAAHVAGYAEVAHRALDAAATAGAATVDADATIDVSELADKLGAALVEPFRRRIERAAAEVDGDADELDERLRAVYREWKVSHIGAATTDALLSAYAQGQMGAAPAGSSVRWLIDPQQGPCPDAQDNALAGAVAAGDAFPTGDTCPQAHPGCRCLLVVET